jgi:hypothetical protein
MTMWTIQEFCDANNSYGVRIARLAAPPPAAPNEANPPSILPGQASTLVTITGTTLFTEGTGLTPSGGITGNNEYTFVRRTSTATGGLPQDTNNNQNDFDFIATTTGTLSGRVPVHGAPGPENLASPVNRNVGFPMALLDLSVGSSSAPNRERDQSAAAVGPNAATGTMTIRRTVTNNTGSTITRLRFRIFDITTDNTPVVSSPQAIMRALNSGTSTVSVGGTPTAVEGTTIETPPAQTLGGGYNSSMGRSVVSGTIINTPIAPGASVNVQFVLGVQQGGYFKFFISIEALP